MHPIIAVSLIAVQNGHLLLVRRAKDPNKDLWTLPGGKVEFGEKLETAVIREAYEETGLIIHNPKFLCHHEIISVSPEREQHYIIAVYMSEIDTTHIHVNQQEISDFCWVKPDAVSSLPTTSGLDSIIAKM